ncbi:MAG: ABC transporter permease [Armatimonadota bacterium]
MKRFLFRILGLALPPLALFVLLIGVWWLLTTQLRIPTYLVPSPNRVAEAAWANRSALVRATLLTGSAALAGFGCTLLLGFLTALAFSQSRLIRQSCYPYAIFLQTVPIVAIAPLIVTWFGTGFRSVVIVSTIIGLFPIITSGTTGLLAVDPKLLELFRLYRAGRWQVLWKLRLPHAVPYLVTGARTSSGLSVIGAIVGEFFVGFSGAQGLGYLFLLTSGQLKTDYLFAAVMASTVLGLTVFGLVNAAAALILRRWGGVEG